MSFKILTVNFLLLIFVGFVFCQQPSSSIELQDVIRTVDLSTQLSNHIITIKFVNGHEPSSSFLFSIPQKFDEHLSFLDVSSDVDPKLNFSKHPQPLKTPSGINFFQYEISLPQTKVITSLRVQMVFTHLLIPYPEKINQAQTQLVRYTDNHYFFTPYKCQNQETRLKLYSSRVESYTKHPPNSLSANQLRYGPYTNVAPFSYSNFTVHFENNSPFITIRKLVKDYEISHWGNLAVEEHYDIEHTGAKLDKFIRFDYFRAKSPSAVEQITQRLDLDAEDIYYRDIIGNVSSSHVSKTPRYIKLEILPRYILFGGWRITFKLGYNLPLQKYLFDLISNPSSHVLNVSFSSWFQEPIIIDSHTVRVIFPEGASNIQVSLPFDVDNLSWDKHSTYLDTVGRPVLVLEKKNVISAHNKRFVVTYTYSRLQMAQEPLLLISAYFAFLVLVMIYFRIDTSIKTNISETDSQPLKINNPQAKELLNQLKNLIQNSDPKKQKKNQDLKKQILNISQELKKSIEQHKGEERVAEENALELIQEILEELERKGNQKQTNMTSTFEQIQHKVSSIDDLVS